MAGIHCALLGAGGTPKFVFAPTLSGDAQNYNLHAAAVTAGWNQLDVLEATVTISSGVVVSASSTANYAFDTGATFPMGSALAVVNNGFIVGMGGRGGDGGGYNGSYGNPGQAGYIGGPALRAQSALIVTNNGTVGGGGGGGGGGASDEGVAAGSGGGGGRTGRTNSGGGTGAGGTQVNGFNGGVGTFASAGVGGDFTYDSEGYDEGGNGGNGGGWGASGGVGGYGDSGHGSAPGGGAGAAVVGNSNITWVTTGTRLGAIT